MTKSIIDLLAFQAAAIHRGCDPLTVIVWTTNGYINQRRDPDKAWFDFEVAFNQAVTSNKNNVNNWSCEQSSKSIDDYKRILKRALTELQLIHPGWDVVDNSSDQGDTQ